MPNNRQSLSLRRVNKRKRETHWEGYVFMVKLVHLGFHIHAIYSDHNRKPLHQENTALVRDMSY